MNKVPLTARGAERLRSELKRLKYEERPQISQAIAEARGHGDLRENAEYHAAKDQQGLVEARIKMLEHTLSHAEIIDVTRLNPGSRIVFGATVDLRDTDSDAMISYQIVGEEEADIKSGLISITSPIARALVGKQRGDVVTVQAPGGAREYEIVEVLYE